MLCWMTSLNETATETVLNEFIFLRKLRTADCFLDSVLSLSVKEVKDVLK